MPKRVVLLMAVLWFFPAIAAEPAVDVQALVNEGTRLFKENRHAEALEQYQAAYAITRQHDLLFMLARCHQELGQAAEAVRRYEELLGGPVGEGPRQYAEKALAALREQLASGILRVTVTPPGAEVRVDGELRGKAPLDPLRVASGLRTVVAREDGFVESSVQVHVPGAGDVAVTLDLKPIVLAQVPEIPTVAGSDGGPGISPWTWVTLGTGLALVAGGAAAWVLGEQDAREVVGSSGYGTDGVTQMTRARAMELQDSADTKRTVGYVLWGVGGAALAGSAVLLTLDLVQDPPPVGVSGVVVGDGGMVSVGGTF